MISQQFLQPELQKNFYKLSQPLNYMRQIFIYNRTSNTLAHV